MQYYSSCRYLRWLQVSFVFLLFSVTLVGCHWSHGTSDYTSNPAPLVKPPAAAPDADFIDLSDQAGLKYHWTHPAGKAWTNLEAFGAGCAFLDYDNDGWMDIFLAGRGRCALYHNNHNGTFTDVTERAGITRQGTWFGVAVGDYDNDGFEDIYVSGYRCSMLLHNNGNGTFTDVTAKAGLQEKEWGSCCAWFDADNDGKLDLLVGHYVQSGAPYPWYCPSATGVPVGCRPQVYPAQFPRLYHNNGNGTFTDVTQRSGLAAAHGKSLAVQFCDYDNDGKIDFYIANDGMPGDMFHNLGHGRFQNVSTEQGTAYDTDGSAAAGMGVDFADYDHDGKMDMVVTDWQGAGFSLYHNDNGHDYTAASIAAGLGMTRHYLGFAAKFFDFNNDGWPDLVFANGHVYDNVEQAEPGTHFRQPVLLFRNERGHFAQVLNPGPGFANPIVGRGLAVGDIYNNGSQDLLVVDFDGHPLLLHNRRPSRNHWLGVKLIGRRSNRDGYGARVTVKWPGGSTFADCTAAGSYLSSMDSRLHFGLGQVARLNEVDVRWPSGKLTRTPCTVPDHYLTVYEAS